MKIKIKHVDTKCETEIAVTCSADPDEKTVELLRQLQQFIKDEDIFGYLGGEAYRLSLQDIFYIEAVDEKTFLYMDQQVYESRQKLYEWELQLEETSFLRISKSTILNIDKLKSVRPLIGGKMEATLANGEKQIINRHYMPAFRQKFGL